VNAHDRYDELAVGHALSALEPEDEVAFLAHLPGCAACERAVAEHRETLGHLAYAASSEEPPASLLEGIRAGVAASGRAGAFPAPAPAPAPVVSLTERRSRTVKLTTALVGVAASVVLVVALVLTNLNLSSRNDDLKQRQLAFERTVNGLLVSGAKRVELTGPVGGSAVAVVHGGQVDLVLSGVPTNDTKDSVYVLWQQDTHGVSAAGTFDVPTEDVTVVSSGLRVSPTGLKQLMITREAGRVAPPTARNQVLYSGSA
jgi:anti-sigma factor RsiW